MMPKPTIYRRLHETLVGLFAVAALAVLVAGIVSYWRGVPKNTIWINTQGSQWQIHVAMIDGTLHAVGAAPANGDPGSLDVEHEYGPFYAKRVHVDNVIAAGAGVPFWALFPVLTLWPLAALVRGPLRRRRRRKRHACVACGYSLHGLVVPRCPECGRPFDPGRRSARSDAERMAAILSIARPPRVQTSASHHR